MSRKRTGWRAAERTYRHLSRALAAAAARERAENVRREQDTVCPDGAACADPKCIAARAAIARGEGWRGAFRAIYGESP